LSIDLFISHASEDKDAVARPLATELRLRGWTVWYDEFDLKMGDPLRGTIDRGLVEARFGLVVLSRSFFRKAWPQLELDGLTAKELAGSEKVILPVWHEVDFDYVLSYSPPLANKLAVQSSAGVPAMVDHIERVLGTPRARQPSRASAGVASARRALAPAKLRLPSRVPVKRADTGRKQSRPHGPVPGRAEATRQISIILGVTILLTVIVIVLVRTVAV
jgi:hypothetical protein